GAAPRGQVDDRRASRAPATDRGGRPLGRDDHRRERRPVDRARPAGGREALGVPAIAGRMKIIFWLLVGVGCVYVFYSGAMTVWSYLEVKGVVEDVVAERAPKSERMYRATQVKEDIAKRVAASGIKVADREISVEDEGKT